MGPKGKDDAQSQAQLEPETKVLQQTQKILFVSYFCKSA